MPRFDKLDPFQKLFTFLVIERSLVLLKLICRSFFPEKSAAVQLLMERQQYVLDRLRGIRYKRTSSSAHAIRDIEAGPSSAFIEIQPDVLQPIKLDQNYVDWETNLCRRKPAPVDFV